MKTSSPSQRSRSPRFVRLTLCGCLALALFHGPAASASAYRFQPIALSGDPIPGFAPDVRFRWFGVAPATDEQPPQIDLERNVSFAGGWTQQFIPHGLFVSRAGALQRLAVTGDAAAGVNANFDAFPGIIPIAARVFDGLGSFDGSFVESPQSSAEQGVWADRFGGRELIFRQTDQPPGTVAGSAFFQWFHTLVGAGHVVVNARYSTGASSEINDHGFWRDDGAGLHVIALARTQAPGVTQGTLFGNGTSLALGAFQSWDVDSSGCISFNAMLMGGGVSDLVDEGIWTEGPVGLQLLAREGGSAPGFGHPNAKLLGNSGFRTFGHDEVIGVVRNHRGDVAFGARVDVPGADTRANAVYVSRGQGLELITYGRFAGANPPGAQAPGFPAGATFTMFSGERMNGLGEVAVQAAVDTGGGVLGETAGLFMERGGSLALVARLAEQAPGHATGVRFTSLFPRKFFDSGHLVFSATLSNGGTGFFLSNPDGSTEHIVSSGLPFDVGPGDVRTIGAIEIGGGFGANRELAFSMNFTDGSEGVFLATPAELVDVASSPDGPSLRLSVLGPNPFHRETSIGFELASPAVISLWIHDVLGREVATLARGPWGAGHHVVRWIGNDDRARPRGAGVYFISLNIGSMKVTQRVVRLP